MIESAKLLNSLSLDELFERWAITRVGAIDGLDTIGVPVWSSCRPLSKVMCISGGKSLDTKLARAGAIAEAIEYSVFENPGGDYELVTCCRFEHFPMSIHFDGKPKIIAIEPVTHFSSGQKIQLPSDLIWSVKRDQEAPIFQRSSTGQALGPSEESAFISGIYECIERDAMTVRYAVFNEFGLFPNPIGVMETPLTEMIKRAGLRPLLFYLTLDIPVHIVLAMLADPTGEQIIYSGYGTDLDMARAQQKAILEAVQSRAIYIAGVRDDLKWDFLEKSREEGHQEFIDGCDQTPLFPTQTFVFKNELQELITRLGAWKQNVFFKHLPIAHGLHAVKAIILGLEPYYSKYWKAGKRWESLRPLFSSAQVSTVAT